MAPHSFSTFDPSRHLTRHDVFFTNTFVKLLIKWSKSLQTRDKIQCVTLPKLLDSYICPFLALKELFKLYLMSSHSSLFQLPSPLGLNPLTDSRVRKTLKLVNLKLGFHSEYFTFHDFRRSGAMFAFNSHIPIQDIKRYGTWSSDCVWQYIQSDRSSGESIAVALAPAINNAQILHPYCVGLQGQLYACLLKFFTFGESCAFYNFYHCKPLWCPSS